MGGSFTNAWVGDFGQSNIDNLYAILSFDTANWTPGDTYILYLTQQWISGHPFENLGGRMVVEYLTSTTRYPDRFVNGAEIAVGNYTLLGNFTASEIFSAGGINISSAIRSMMAGSHNRYLYLRFRFPVCSNGDTIRDQTVMATGVANLNRAKIGRYR